MIPRLVILCAVELAIAVALALALTTGSPAGAADAAAAQPAPVAPRIDIEGAAAPVPAPAPATNVEATARAEAPSAVEQGHAARSVVSPKVQPDDPVGVLLTGTVRWRDGTPVAEPRVWASSGKENRGADTAGDGSFAVARLAPGAWTFKVAADGAVALETTVAITDDSVQQREFVLDRSFPVRVRIVTPDGQDATRALRMTLRTGGTDFHVAGQKEGFPRQLAPTDYGRVFVGDAKWDGENNPENGFAGTLSFVEPLPGHVALLLRNLVIEQQVVQPDQKEVLFVVDPEALKARLGSATVRLVDDATGAPLEGINVAFNTSNAMSMGPKTDADGRAVADNLAPGLFQFTVMGKGRESVYQVVRVDPGQRLDLGELRLGAPQNLKGRVVTADGAPASAALSWTELKWRGAPTAFAHNRVARAEADGSFEIWGTGAGPIAVTARGPDGSLAAAVFDNPPVAPVELRLQSAAECVITRPRDWTRSFVVTLYDARHRAIASRDIEPRSLEYRLPMPPGDYAFEVHDDRGQLLQSGTLQFGATPAQLEIR